MILTLNNIIFYQELMQKIRYEIKNNTFDDFHDKYINIIVRIIYIGTYFTIEKN